MNYIKKNITLVAALCIPFLMILFITASIYLPNLWSQPKYNFVYVVEDYEYGFNQYFYEVKDGKLIKNPPAEDPFSNFDASKQPKLYKYDTDSGRSQELSFNDSQGLMLNPNEISPDGYKFIQGSQSGSFFPFLFYSSSNSDSYYLQARIASKKIDLIKDGTKYQNIRFLGWIK